MQNREKFQSKVRTTQIFYGKCSIRTYGRHDRMKANHLVVVVVRLLAVVVAGSLHLCLDSLFPFSKKLFLSTLLFQRKLVKTHDVGAFSELFSGGALVLKKYRFSFFSLEEKAKYANLMLSVL